jgi:glucose-6-phosphate 1-epimerase
MRTVLGPGGARKVYIHAMSTCTLTEYHGLPAVRWENADGARAVATLQGAHLVSWTLPGGEECLFMSERSSFESGKAIRGGIPIVFPQFAERGPLMKHGFARTSQWTFDGRAFVLESSPETRERWPGEFRLEALPSLGESRLEVELRVTNNGGEAFEFAAALHTYLRVSEARVARLEGLEELRYEDCGSNGSIDRIYFSGPPSVRLDDGARILTIEQRGFCDTVVWNPGPELTARMPDMPPEGYRHMYCVEAAAIDPPVTLAPGATWTGTQAIQIKGTC